ncbi:MAG: hypothetical protein P4L87_00765 [Formivibrio sp.]|nr:hypothetical protein [Formivibrio sp.]
MNTPPNRHILRVDAIAQDPQGFLKNFTPQVIEHTDSIDTEPGLFGYAPQEAGMTLRIKPCPTQSM